MAAVFVSENSKPPSSPLVEGVCCQSDCRLLLGADRLAGAVGNGVAHLGTLRALVRLSGRPTYAISFARSGAYSDGFRSKCFLNRSTSERSVGIMSAYCRSGRLS